MTAASASKSGVRFLKHAVDVNGVKIRVRYSVTTDIKTNEVVAVVYSKDYGHDLAVLDSENYRNDTDTQTDYFTHGRVKLRAGHPLFEAALARCQANEQAFRDKLNGEKAATKLNVVETEVSDEDNKHGVTQAWEVVARGITYRIQHRPTARYSPYVVLSNNKNARMGGGIFYATRVEQIETKFRSLRGLAVALVIKEMPANCVAFKKMA